MARDLAVDPYRSALIAPLFMPLVSILLAALDGRLSTVGGFDDFAGGILVVWVVAFAYMWILAVPAMSLTRRWITWTWWRLITLGAFLGALPWFVYLSGWLVTQHDSWSPGEAWREYVRSLLSGDSYMVLRFAACGAFVASMFCLLQTHVFQRHLTTRSSRP